MGCTRLREERIMERHPNRENAIALYLKEHLGAAEVMILVDHPSREGREAGQAALHRARLHARA